MLLIICRFSMAIDIKSLLKFNLICVLYFQLAMGDLVQC